MMIKYQDYVKILGDGFYSGCEGKAVHFRFNSEVYHSKPASVDVLVQIFSSGKELWVPETDLEKLEKPKPMPLLFQGIEQDPA